MKHFTLLLAAAALSVSAYAADITSAVNLASPKNKAFVTKCDCPNRLSRDVEWESWTMSYTGVDSQGYLVETSSKMDVAIDGDEIKIAGWHTYLAGMYVTGTISGSTITFDNYQFIGTDTKWHDDAYLLATNMIVQNQQITGFETVGATYTMNYDAENKVITPVGDNFAWIVNTGDGEEPNDCYNYILWPELKYVEPQDVVVLPETAVVENWIMTAYDGKTGQETSLVTKVAFDGSDVYFGGFNESVIPNAWVKGAVDGNKITLANPQYVGYVDKYGMDFYMLGANMVQTSEGLSIGDIPATLTFDYDAAKGTITAPELLAYCVNAAPDRVYYLDMFIGPVWNKVKTDAEPAAPVNPELYGFVAYDAAAGYGGMVWTISQLSTNGGIIPTDKLFYTCYADGEVYLLEPEDYVVDEAIEMIPYMLQPEDTMGDYGIYVDEYGPGTRAVWFYREILESIGCRAIYKDGDTLYKSQICWGTLNDDDTITVEYVDEIPEGGHEGIAGVAMDQDVRSIEYYNVAGQKVNNPNGLTIVKVTLNDGTVKAIKVNK